MTLEEMDSDLVTPNGSSDGGELLFIVCINH